MATFRDAAGRTWIVAVEVDAIRRVRNALKVNLAEMPLEQLLGDPVLIADVLYVLCQPQAEKEKVSDVDFARALHGDAFEQATHALLEAMADFTPNQRRRALVRNQIKALWKVSDKETDLLDKTATLAVAQAEAELAAKLQEVASGSPSGRSSGSSPAPSA